MRSEQGKPLILPLFAPSIASDRNWFRLDQLADVIDCPHSTPELIDDPNAPLVVRSQDMRSGTFMTALAGRVSEDTYKERISRAEPQFGDLLYSREGTYFGIAAEVPPGVRVCLGQRMVLIRPKADRIDHKFLRHWLNSPQIFGHIHGFRDGTVAERPNLPTIRGLAVALPALKVQQKVGEILGALDDRITLLRETNATLEAIAQALFKSWFVDFDPVRAKAEGRQPEGAIQGCMSAAEGRMPKAAMDAATAALFPDSFEESELGLVPKGWMVKPVGDAVDCLGGGTPDTKEPGYWEPAEHCWTTPKDLSGLQSPVLLQTERQLSTLGLAKVSSGLLPAGTLLLSSRAPIGYLAIAQMPVAVNQGYIAIPPGGELSPLYMLFWCRQNMEAIKGRANGSTFMEISKKAFRPIPTLVPSAEILDAFARLAEPLLERLVENERQAQTLTQLRDTLLPRLISGQLRLPEAEALIEEAV
ncbi:MAG: restriction endonuclease subunit S [Pseudomonadota bacterium]|nr:restriction endonuclease subunit S [Pseudomonadota bacterium]